MPHRHRILLEEIRSRPPLGLQNAILACKFSRSGHPCTRRSRPTHPAERLKPLHYPLSSAVATVGRRVLVRCVSMWLGTGQSFDWKAPKYVS